MLCYPTCLSAVSHHSHSYAGVFLTWCARSDKLLYWLLSSRPERPQNALCTSDPVDPRSMRGNSWTPTTNEEYQQSKNTWLWVGWRGQIRAEVASRTEKKRNLLQKHGVPPCAVLSPFLSNMYLKLFVGLVRKHKMQCFQHSDDTQLSLCLIHLQWHGFSSLVND